MKKLAALFSARPAFSITRLQALPTEATQIAVPHAAGTLQVLLLSNGAWLAASPLKANAARTTWLLRWPQLIIKTAHKISAPTHPVKLAIFGTDFQCATWLKLACLKPQALCSYADLAVAIGRPKATRAVGSAVGKNPLAPFIPCHRVIASNGSIGGYTGGLPRKRKLLALEQVFFSEFSIIAL